MTVDDLIDLLKRVDGKLLVVVYDGGDPSNLVEVQHVNAEELYFSRARGSGYGKSLVVSLV